MSKRGPPWPLESLDLRSKLVREATIFMVTLDNGRRFKVEMQQNKAERYLLVSVMSEDERRYFEFFQRALTFCVGKQ